MARSTELSSTAMTHSSTTTSSASSSTGTTLPPPLAAPLLSFLSSHRPSSLPASTRPVPSGMTCIMAVRDDDDYRQTPDQGGVIYTGQRRMADRRRLWQPERSRCGRGSDPIPRRAVSSPPQ
ncbi:hypothetical protein SEVIR_6G014250v4 [Setaria viridis]